MRLYRLTYLISPKLDKEEAVQLSQKIIAFLKEKKGELLTNKEIVKKELAYPIQKEKLSYLADCTFNLPVAELPALKKFLSNLKDIKRFLLVNTKPEIVKPLRAKSTKKQESVDERLNKILES